MPFQEVDCPSFKLLMLGDAGTGKTTFLKRLLTGEYDTRHGPTVGTEYHSLCFFTNRGKIQFNCFDVSGGDTNSQILYRAINYPGAHCAIVMFDVTSELTYTNLSRWQRELSWSLYEDIPIVLCANKIDVEKHLVEARLLKYRSKRWFSESYNISAKTGYNLEKPFLYFARTLLGDPNLHFVESPALAPTEVQVDNIAVFRDPNLHFVESPAPDPPEVQVDNTALQQCYTAAGSQPFPGDLDASEVFCRHSAGASSQPSSANDAAADKKDNT